MRRAWIVLAILSLFLLPTSVAGQLFTAPDPKVTIPGFTDLEDVSLESDKSRCFSRDDPRRDDPLIAGCYFIPWIGEYISGIYTFAVALSTIVAAIVIMAAGFMWLTAGGNVNQIGTAKSYLGGALLGLFLMLGSYTILYAVNPNLVRFNAIRLPAIKHASLRAQLLELSDAGAEIGQCSVRTLSVPTSIIHDPEVQKALNEAGAEFDISPIYLAAIAARESSFNPGAESPVGAYGITQIMPKTASEIWDNNRELTRPDDCKGPNDPILGSYTDTCKAWMRNNPREAIRMGAAYFRTINNHLSSCGHANNPTLMAAGYNAGPYRQTLCQGGVPNFEETTEYVKRVKQLTESMCRESNGEISDTSSPPGLLPAPDPTTL